MSFLLLSLLLTIAVVAAGNYNFLSSNACESVTSKSSCTSKSDCEWCSSGAVGDSCVSSADAASLPSSVFSCSTGKKALPEAKGLQAGERLPHALAAGSGTIGLDFSAALTANTAACFISNGAGAFVIPRGYRSSGVVDTNACASMQTAMAAGIPRRETYIFPCPTCPKTATTQMSELVAMLKSCGSAFTGRIWLDIEGGQYWTGSTSTNKAWYQELVDACTASGYTCGVYSSASQWQAIFGSTSYSYGASLSSWYAHYDNHASFSDFSPFGGWTAPQMKQYQGDVTVCGTDVDMNYSPYF